MLRARATARAPTAHASATPRFACKSLLSSCFAEQPHSLSWLFQTAAHGCGLCAGHLPRQLCRAAGPLGRMALGNLADLKLSPRLLTVFGFVAMSNCIRFATILWAPTRGSATRRLSGAMSTSASESNDSFNFIPPRAVRSAVVAARLRASASDLWLPAVFAGKGPRAKATPLRNSTSLASSAPGCPESEALFRPFYVEVRESPLDGLRMPCVRKRAAVVLCADRD